jgi:hypothetical protein
MISVHELLPKSPKTYLFEFKLPHQLGKLKVMLHITQTDAGSVMMRIRAACNGTWHSPMTGSTEGRDGIAFNGVDVRGCRPGDVAILEVGRAHDDPRDTLGGGAMLVDVLVQIK